MISEIIRCAATTPTNNDLKMKAEPTKRKKDLIVLVTSLNIRPHNYEEPLLPPQRGMLRGVERNCCFTCIIHPASLSKTGIPYNLAKERKLVFDSKRIYSMSLSL